MRGRFLATCSMYPGKYWERPLEERQADTSRDRLRDRRRSPHFQIIDYIDDADGFRRFYLFESSGPAGPFQT